MRVRPATQADLEAVLLIYEGARRAILHPDGAAALETVALKGPAHGQVALVGIAAQVGMAAERPLYDHIHHAALFPRRGHTVERGIGAVVLPCTVDHAVGGVLPKNEDEGRVQASLLLAYVAPFPGNIGLDRFP